MGETHAGRGEGIKERLGKGAARLPKILVLTWLAQQGASAQMAPASEDEGGWAPPRARAPGLVEPRPLFGVAASVSARPRPAGVLLASARTAEVLVLVLVRTAEVRTVLVRTVRTALSVRTAGRAPWCPRAVCTMTACVRAFLRRAWEPPVSTRILG